MDALVSELSGGLLVDAEPRESGTGPRSVPGASADLRADPDPDTGADLRAEPDPDTGADLRADPDPDTGHRLALYKNADRLSASQDARRRDLLHRQKRSVSAAQCPTRQCWVWVYFV